MESPANVVAVLHPDISPVSDSVNGSNPTNVLQTEIQVCLLRGACLISKRPFLVLNATDCFDRDTGID